MRIVIVGRRGEKRQIRWLAFPTLAITLWLLVGLGSGSVYFLLCGRWSYVAALYGGSMGLAFIVVSLRLCKNCTSCHPRRKSSSRYTHFARFAEPAGKGSFH